MIAREPYGMKYEERGLSGEQPVRYHESVYHEPSNLRMHYHSSLEINLCHDAAGIINIEGQKYDLSACSLICLNPDVLHSYQIEGNGGSIEVWHIGLEYLDYVDGRQVLELLSQAGASVLMTDFGGEEIPGLLQQVTDHDGISRASALLNLVGRLTSGSTQRVYRERSDRFLVDILSFAGARFQGDVSLEEAASSVNMSRYHFARKFKQKTGSTFMEYILNLRLEHSLQVLGKGLSVAEAASDSGFEDVSYFIKRFRQQFGLTPGKYQRYLCKEKLI